MADRSIWVSTYSKAPGPRYRNDGPHSAQEYREEILGPELKDAIETKSVLTVILSGVAGYGSSFLDEAFAGLLRAGFTSRQLEEHLRIDPGVPRFRHHVRRIDTYMNEEQQRQAKAVA